MQFPSESGRKERKLNRPGSGSFNILDLRFFQYPSGIRTTSTDAFNLIAINSNVYAPLLSLIIRARRIRRVALNGRFLSDPSFN